MITRPIEAEDIPRLQELWKQKGFECTTPDFAKLGGTVLLDDEGIIRMALADRKTVELYMLLDRTGWASPGMKFTHFGRLHEAERQSLMERGFEDVHAWLPRCARSFAYKLRKFFGWVSSSGPNRDWDGLTRNV